MTMDSDPAQPPDTTNLWLHDLEELRRSVGELEGRLSALGAVNPRAPGWHNGLIQVAKKVFARTFNWYTRPFQEFNANVSRCFEEIDRALSDLAAHALTLEWRLAQLERSNAGSSPANYKTTYVIGLFGSGRQYILGLILQNMGERAKYFRDTIRFHPAATPMIYSGHATIKHVSRAQFLPEVTRRVLESVRAGFADLIFVYRHPLDSLLTNWIWWRTYIRDNRKISGVSEVYKNADDLCADLEKNFLEFKSFAEGNPDFFAGLPGTRFLSFSEFVEETELYLEAATLALRLEDFMIDPCTHFSKIAELIAIDSSSSRPCVDPPRSKAYGFLVVKEKVPLFRKFVDELDQETQRRIEKIGYKLGI